MLSYYDTLLKGLGMYCHEQLFITLSFWLQLLSAIKNTKGIFKREAIYFCP